MSDRAKGKNHRPGTPPRAPRVYKPGRGRPAKGYDPIIKAWLPGPWKVVIVDRALIGL